AQAGQRIVRQLVGEAWLGQRQEAERVRSRCDAGFLDADPAHQLSPLDDELLSLGPPEPEDRLRFEPPPLLVVRDLHLRDAERRDLAVEAVEQAVIVALGGAQAEGNATRARLGRLGEE